MGSADIINRFGKFAKNGSIVAFSTLILTGCDDTGQFNLGQSLRGMEQALHHSALEMPQKQPSAMLKHHKSSQRPKMVYGTDAPRWVAYGSHTQM